MNEQSLPMIVRNAPELEGSRENPVIQRIVARTKRGFFFLRDEEILWIEAEGSHCSIQSTGENVRIRKSISDFERELDPRNFVRISRSWIVNVNHIRILKPWRKGDYEVTMRDGTVLHWSRTFRNNMDSMIERMHAV